MEPDSKKNMEPLASEIYQDLKTSIKFKTTLIWVLLGIIAVLIVALAGTNIYHIYQWSQFDTVIVDSGDGSGNANYVQGDNAGGIYNGESSSTPQENER